jgi:23S rRNA (guanosine2251-2'-O)-methyltransferase
MKDSKEYLEKKAFFENILTFYGRHSVIELLSDTDVHVYKVHLSKSNKIDDNVKKIVSLANKRSIEIKYHNKDALSRISKNAKQDQGVAIDVVINSYKSAQMIDNDFKSDFKFIALDGINNPQNLGMIIRTVAASNVDALILGESCTKISPLVMKSSAGTLFKLPIYHTKNLSNTLNSFKDTKIYSLSSYAKQDIRDIKKHHKEIFVLGNESSGVSESVNSTCNESIKIDMNRGVESLNVAIATAIISFL